MSNASEVAVSKPCFSYVPTGSNMRTSPGQIVRHDATHSSFLPAFHKSACLVACAKRARRLGTLLIAALPLFDLARALRGHDSGKVLQLEGRGSRKIKTKTDL